MNNSRRGAGEGFFLFALGMLMFLFVLLRERNKEPGAAVVPGVYATVKESSMRVYVVEYSSGTNVRCRLDNGPGTAPRYQEMVFRIDELMPLPPEVEKK